MASALCRRVRKLYAASRLFSTAGSSGSDEPYVAVSSQDSEHSRTVWPDETMGPFGPQDKRFQLPGNVGFDCHLGGTGDRWVSLARGVVPDVLLAPSSSDRHEFVLTQFITEFQSKDVSVWTQSDTRAETYFAHCNVECSVHSCPELLKQELETFFPALPASAITVVTVTRQNTATLSELDREQLLDKFVQGAKDLCFTLWCAGYWADFIHPSTGRACFGAPSQDSAVQPVQPHSSGFHIEDLASCRVIHHVWKDTPVFVGALLTNAPASSLVMERLTEQSADPVAHCP